MDNQNYLVYFKVALRHCGRPSQPPYSPANLKGASSFGLHHSQVMGRGPKRYFAVLLFEIRHSRVTTLRSLGEKTHWQPFVSILGLHHSQALGIHLLEPATATASEYTIFRPGL